MIHATPEQRQRLLALLEDIPAEQIQDILESGLLSDLLIANVSVVNPEEFREVLGLMSLKDQRHWYVKALKKVQGFLPELDPGLVVAIRSIRVTTTPGKSYAEYRSTLALAFAHRTDQNMRWTMVIGENDEYIEIRLQDVVTELFREKRGW
ncbi:MAG TPA: hypothetical protein VLG69_01125 [Candidatus Andersenbacteria bacterium]|nr:hypothetical protein [Candidatus Andersenbacteria bacterium]